MVRQTRNSVLWRKEAIFLDRDGVINANRPDYVKTWEEFNFLPNVFGALRDLTALGLPIIIITNQSSIGRGIVKAATIEAIHQSMVSEIARHGGRIDACYYCPHIPEFGCDCRKPKPGLLYRAAQDFRINLANSYFIGDALTDIRAAQSAGCHPILILTGTENSETLQILREEKDSVPTKPDLPAAVHLIMNELRRS